MNNAGDLNDYMFEQLERLNELDASGDRDALMAEVRRARTDGARRNGNRGRLLPVLKPRLLRRRV